MKAFLLRQNRCDNVQSQSIMQRQSYSDDIIMIYFISKYTTKVITTIKEMMSLQNLF